MINRTSEKDLFFFMLRKFQLILDLKGLNDEGNQNLELSGRCLLFYDSYLTSGSFKQILLLVWL